ncbi:hypothetical protein [Catellatospora tritici]|uniref:hypothetical protein n=1 Tax=Catellatospora tritici TaxID=2851566 RepID=UPI001C2CD69A|nr:hypothetical protein [Catellatospora tritici]MBV1851886.1 hypothetical protein [Catellatospora tritici]
MTVRNRMPIAVLTAVVAGLCVSACNAKAPSGAVAAPPTASSSPPAPLTDRDGDGFLDSADLYPDDPTNTPNPVVTADCYLDPDFGAKGHYVISVDVNRRPIFTEAWAETPESCDVIRGGTPPTPIEVTALETAKYEVEDLKYLYEICAEVQKEDVYAGRDFAASSSQIPEISGALVLCPTHPHAAAWKKSIARGRIRAGLEQQGRVFGSGTYLVGKEIKPGTYAITGDVTSCYWERQDRNGKIIANNFILAARRVQVTIRSSDYAFHSDGCGEWSPA